MVGSRIFSPWGRVHITPAFPPVQNAYLRKARCIQDQNKMPPGIARRRVESSRVALHHASIGRVPRCHAL
jgi:hypothetical protein